MSETIDNRVVEMRFDNQQFESNIQTSLTSLEKLKQSLNLSGAAKGLDEVSNSTKGINMSGLGSAVDTVRARFSALQVMGVAALANIANSAINAGKRLVESFALDPIKEGFGEYELKMGSIQTIMASTGESIDTVNKYLNELNEYSDKTIYSFSDMTQNIGKFTNAGVSLDKAVGAIKGVSNVAAISGANTNEASRSMYNFAQALAAGKVQAIDWKSIDLANMGTVEFKQQLIDTAVALGTVKKQGDQYVSTTKDLNGNVSDTFDSTNNFNKSLSSQWMTTKVLIQTLNQYATDVRDLSQEEKETYEKQLRKIGYTKEQIKSIEELGIKAADSAKDVKTFSQLMDTLKEAVGTGWADTFEIIFGNLEEAKSLWTGVSDVVGGYIKTVSDARNNMLKEWKELGGRTAIIDGLKNAFDGLVSVITPIGQAFREIFPPITGKQLFTFSKGFKEFTSHLKLSGTASENLKRTFKGLFAIFDIGKNVLTTVFNVIKSVFSLFDGAGEGILGVTAAWGDWLVSLDQVVKKGTGVADVIQNVVDAIKNFGGSIGGNMNFSGFEFLDGIIGRIQKRIVGLKKAFDDAQAGVSSFFQTFNGLGGVVGKVTAGFGNLMSGVIEKIGKADFSKFFDFFNLLSMGGLGVGVFKVLDKFNDIAKNNGTGSGIVGFLTALFQPLQNFGNIGKGVVDILDGVKGSLEAYQTKLKAGALLQIAAAIAILAASITVISLIDSKKLASSLGAITVLFTNLMGSMAVFSKFSGSIKGTVKAISAMIGLSVAVFIMASALKKIGDLEPAKLVAGVLGILTLTAILTDVAKKLSAEGPAVMKGTTQLVIFAVAIKILASACKQLSVLSFPELVKGLGGVAILMEVLSRFMKKATFSYMAIETAAGIAMIAVAMKILASACKDLGNMNTGQMIQGLIGIGVLLAALSTFLNKTTFGPQAISTAAGIAIMAAALKILASACKDLGSMNTGQMIQGLAGIGIILLEIQQFTKRLGNPQGMIKSGAALITIGVAMKLFTSAIRDLSGLSVDQLGIGLGGIAGALLLIGATMKILGKTASSDMLVVAASFVVMATALNLLVPVLTTLGAMDVVSLGKALGSLAAAFVIIGVAGAVLAPVVPAILALSGAIALLGIGFAGIGAGLLLAGAGLSAIAVGFAALATSVGAGAAAITAGLTVIITGLASLIPMVAAKIGEGIITFCAVIGAGASTIANAAVAVVNAVITALIQTIPNAVNALFLLLTTFMTTLQQYEPTLVQTGCDILVSFLNGIANNISRVVQAGIDIVLGVIDGIKQKLPDIIQAGFDLIIAYIDGLSKAIDENGPRLVDSMKNLILSTINAAVLVLTGGVVNFKSMGKQLMESGLVKGLKEKASAFGTKVKETVSNGVKAVRGKLSEWYSSGKAVIEKLVTGVKSKAKAFATEAKNTVTKALDAVKKKFKEWRDAGKSMVEKFIAGIKSKIDGVRRAASELVSRAKNALNKSGEARSAGANFGEGFKSGIMSVASRVADAARSLVSRAISAAKSAQKSASPSKVTRALGRYFGSGYILGIQDMRGKLVKSTETVFGKVIDATSGIIENGNSLLSGFGQTFLADTRDLTPATKTLNSVANAISELMNVIPEDTSPTIRPVLDLSAVKDGANSLNNLFTSQYMIPAMANINGISSTMRSRNSGNTDVVEAIYSLKKELGKMGGVTNNIGDVTYDDGSNVSTAISALVRAIKMGRRG